MSELLSAVVLVVIGFTWGLWVGERNERHSFMRGVRLGIHTERSWRRELSDDV